MINWSLNDFCWALRLLEQEAAEATFKELDHAHDPIAPNYLKRFRQNLQGIAAPLHALFIAEGRLGDLATLARLGGTYGDLAHELHALKSDIAHAVQFERFYHYPREKGLMVLRVPGDWAPTIKAFPSSEEDVKAAVDCYALGHNHASVHHSMMVLEFGLPALAKRLRVAFNPDKATWAELTREIGKKIAADRLALANTPRGSKPPSRAVAKKRSGFLDACEEAAIEFRYFTTVWRNHVAHGRGDYDQNDAKKVLEHVRTFMEVIATKLKLKE